LYKNIPIPIKQKSQITPDLNIHQTSIKNNPANTISKNIKNFTKHNIKNQFYWLILFITIILQLVIMLTKMTLSF